MDYFCTDKDSYCLAGTRCRCQTSKLTSQGGKTGARGNKKQLGQGFNYCYATSVTHARVKKKGRSVEPVLAFVLVAVDEAGQFQFQSFSRPH